MTSTDEHDFPYYRSPRAIREETFPRRLRGFDEHEVREYLDLLADQVQATDHERRELHAEHERVLAENGRLQAEVQRLRAELSEVEDVGGRVNDQVVELFSQAQLIAEEMVQDASRDSRDRLGLARDQERQILQEALQTAEETRRDAEALIRWATPAASNAGSPSYSLSDPLGLDPVPAGIDSAAAAAELEQVRSYARAAQAQMKSLMDAFATQVERFGGSQHTV